METRKLDLMLHCGASVAERQEVIDTITPEATKTHIPIPHEVLIGQLTDQLPEYGMRIVNEAHGLTKDGARYFGLFQVAGTDGAELSNDFGLVFGLRNTHDKTFPAGISLGNAPFVCDNLVFSNEIVLGRKHTRYIMRDLPNLISTAMGKLMDARQSQENRIACYKEFEINDQQAHDLVIKSLRGGAINCQRVPKVVDQWHKPNHPEFEDKTMYRLLNAFSEAYKGGNINELAKKSTRLHGILDSAAGIARQDAKSALQEQFANNTEVIVV